MQKRRIVKAEQRWLYGFIMWSASLLTVVVVVVACIQAWRLMQWPPSARRSHELQSVALFGALAIPMAAVALLARHLLRNWARLYKRARKVEHAAEDFLRTPLEVPFTKTFLFKWVNWVATKWDELERRQARRKREAKGHAERGVQSSTTRTRKKQR